MPDTAHESSITDPYCDPSSITIPSFDRLRGVKSCSQSHLASEKQGSEFYFGWPQSPEPAVAHYHTELTIASFVTWGMERHILKA